MRCCNSGGTERAFSSTTADVWTAYSYSGGWDEAATLLQIDVDNATCPASLQFLSVFPREQEFLFPPLTSHSVREATMRGNKRILECVLHLSPATLDSQTKDSASTQPEPCVLTPTSAC